MFKNLAIFLIVLGLITGCVSTTNLPICDRARLPPVDGPNTVENSLGQPVMWDQWAFPLQVTLDPNLSEEKRTATFEAMEVWEQVTGLDVFVYVGDGPNPNRRGTVWVTESELSPTPCGGQILGYAHRHFALDALGIRTRLNNSWIEYHSGTSHGRISATAIHEFGHILGLNHDAEIESIMFPYNQPQRSNQITEEDVQFVINMITAPREADMFFVPKIF